MRYLGVTIFFVSVWCIAFVLFALPDCLTRFLWRVFVAGLLMLAYFTH